MRNIVNSLRAPYGWALPRGLAPLNPTRGLRLPTGEKVRDRIAAPAEVAALIAALNPKDQAALGLAAYAGLRLGEVLALDWTAVDLETRTLRVLRSWDPGERAFVAPESKAGTRTVPIPTVLCALLADHRVLMNYSDGLLFPGDDPRSPLHPTTLRDRLARAWNSVMIAAGVNIKALSTFMGHASITITLDRYGHLLPGSEDVAADLFNAYLAKAAA